MTREETIKYMESWKNHMSDNGEIEEAEAFHVVTEAIKRKIGFRVQEWIPISERLPEAWKPVLITDIKGNVNMLKWSHKEYWVDCDKEEFYGYNDWVIAWMPLPEPYREEGEV